MEWMDYNKTVEHLRAIIKRKQFYVEKRLGGERRKAFFSFVEEDRREEQRRVLWA